MTKHDSRSSGGQRSGHASANQDEAPATRSLRRLPERLRTDMRVDVSGSATARPTTEDNQQVADEYAHVSLELLALLSPHGTTQQWEDDDAFEIHPNTMEQAKRLSMLARVDLAECSTTKTSQSPLPDLTSPSQHMVPFQASPTHSAHGNELDLASPVTLPETPKPMALWEDDSVTDMEVHNLVDPAGASEIPFNTAYPSPSTCSQRSESSHIRTPAKSVPSKPKARHGGIYSLLLKNKPPEHEPVLVEEKRSPLGPEVSPKTHSADKKMAPSSLTKLQHGGIYGLLRHSSS